MILQSSMFIFVANMYLCFPTLYIDVSSLTLSYSPQMRLIFPLLCPQGSTLSLPSLSSILPQLFRAVFSNAGSLNETFYLILGLLGQLLLRITPTKADAAVTEALADKYELLTQGDAACSDTQGLKTTQLLFSLGAVCLDRYTRRDVRRHISFLFILWFCVHNDTSENMNSSVTVLHFHTHCSRIRTDHFV